MKIFSVEKVIARSHDSEPSPIEQKVVQRGVRLIPKAVTFCPQEEIMGIEEKIGQAVATLDEEESKEFDWESNRDDENPKDLPWPEENESKE